MTKPYEILSGVYDIEWSNFAPKFVPLILKIFEKKDFRSIKVLDLACGTGILAKKLADMGFKVIGVDSSPQMIGKARGKVKGDNPIFYLQDMEFFNLQETFNLVTCIFDSINYLKTRCQLRNMFERVFRVLEPGGFFIFDSATHRMFNEFHKGRFSYNLDGISFTQFLVYRPLRRTAETRFDFDNGLKEVHHQYPHGYIKLRRILSKCGFSGIIKLPYKVKKEYGISRKRLVCIARKG